jgi:hypothetical protein
MLKLLTEGKLAIYMPQSPHIPQLCGKDAPQPFLWAPQFFSWKDVPQIFLWEERSTAFSVGSTIILWDIFCVKK